MSIKKQQQKGRVSVDRRVACAQVFQESTHCTLPQAQWAGHDAERWQDRWWKERAGIKATRPLRCQRQCARQGFLKKMYLGQNFLSFSHTETRYICILLTLLYYAILKSESESRSVVSLCDPKDYRYRIHDQNTEVDSCSLLQRIFPIQG